LQKDAGTLWVTDVEKLARQVEDARG